MPFAGAFPAATALAVAARLQAGIVVRQSGPRPSGFARLPVKGVASRNYLAQLDGRLVCSTVKPAEDGKGLIVRLWNPGRRAASERLRLHGRFSSAVYCGVNEEPTGERVTRSGNTFSVRAIPKRIVTIRLTPARTAPRTRKTVGM
jgi:alpha-mannosidase